MVKRLFHRFIHDIENISLPEKFTFPFHYVPHKLVSIAATEVMDYLETCTQWTDELQNGKMFGVLVAADENDEVGYLAAFSGNLAGCNIHPFFVPPVFDFLQKDGYFKKEESNISGINKEISNLISNPKYIELQRNLEDVRADVISRLADAKYSLKKAKQKREEKRTDILTKEGRQLTEEESQAMIRESQFQKAEYKRLEKQLKEKVAEAELMVKSYNDIILELKAQRRERSAALQLWLFQQFDMLNANSESMNLCDIFKDTPQGLPPAGAGECALPKLLQFAYKNHFRPLAMGEFWYGMSPKDEIRHHGYFYPSCKGKCEPILKHMLVGLDVEPNPLAEDKFKGVQLEVLYEDEWIIAVNKPSGMLSVPGKNDLDSVQHRLMKMYPQSTGPMVVHRLDMATSGILLAAKTKDVHSILQSMFEERTIKKQYIAILDGVPVAQEGVIELPICLNPYDRPRQMVDYEHGKPSVTSYKIVKTFTRDCSSTPYSVVLFSPHTGRTHQLRVHSAHPDGLNCPISGDDLYGNPRSASRLCLHAASLTFVHPITGEEIKIESECDLEHVIPGR